MQKLSHLRNHIRSLHRADQEQVLRNLINESGPDAAQRQAASKRAVELIRQVRGSRAPGLMEAFLAEYGLSTDEGIALMCLAEALLRVPDAPTIDELIEDKIAPSSWGAHLGQSSSSLVNASTWALMLTGKVLKDPETQGITDMLRGAVRRLGEPVIRAAVKRAMQEMGHQFVLGRNIEEALKRGRAQENLGFTYSYDMLGEAALTAADATAFFDAYKHCIETLARHANKTKIRENPGISIKLSALHPRYEVSQRGRVIRELVPRVTALALLAKDARIGLNIDAEEADRLDLSLDVIEAVVRNPVFNNWEGFGVVVQAYGKRGGAIIDWLWALATKLDRKFMIRLVKGAYWDAEIKQAQVDGVPDFPVFTDKAATDVSYICCAQKLLKNSDRLYPQFATHNAHTVAAILEMAKPDQAYEFQRLHGMGEALHKIVHERHQTKCRIYAPVGAHRDLLAYLVRRLLENGANSSFVNQLVDTGVAPAVIASDPFAQIEHGVRANALVKRPQDLYAPERVNALGWDLRNIEDLTRFHKARDRFKSQTWAVTPLIAGDAKHNPATVIVNPSNPSDHVGQASTATLDGVEQAMRAAKSWSASSATDRKSVLTATADLYEENAGEICALLCREAGKTALDAIAELREAVDFLRFYAVESVRHGQSKERGIITCISPWNFPLAIFTGQIAAALGAGNGVLAKPAEPTPIIACVAVKLLHQAGVPTNVLQLVPGDGAIVGSKLTTDPRVNGVCFTGSTGVAKLINRAASQSLEPDATFIAETGGINAMIVDSTALPEQTIKDVVDSAFRSCGQRCSALRVLYLQSDIADGFLEMLYGAMDQLELSDPWNVSCDVGPVITARARQGLINHINTAQAQGRLLKQLAAPETGTFFGPAVVQVDGIKSLKTEIFGPVLHVARFDAHEIDQVVADINNSGYGLTFGLHTRIDDRVEHITQSLKVGNLYVNRNQIGAVVGSQPFGGEGLSGTGPKAGGAHYLRRFKRYDLPDHPVVKGPFADLGLVQIALKDAKVEHPTSLETRDLPGPTGESNRWSIHGRGTLLCLGPTPEDIAAQMQIAKDMKCVAIGVAPDAKGPQTIAGFLDRAALTVLEGFDAVALWSDARDLAVARSALAEREGPILPLISTDKMHDFCVVERHLCINTTAAGGNASLLAG